FQAGKVVPSEIERDPIASRWQRVAATGLAADSPAHPDGVANSDLAERRSRLDELLGRQANGHADLARLPPALAARPVTMILADDEGVIVRAHAEGYARRALDSRLVPGARWNEHARGTNAIGTAIEERRSVAIIGRAHYERVNHPLFCYASPIVDP